MFQKVFEYAGPHKKGLYAATAVVLVSVLMGVLPLRTGLPGDRAVGYGGSDRRLLRHSSSGFSIGMPGFAGNFLWLGLNISHKAAYDTPLCLGLLCKNDLRSCPLE